MIISISGKIGSGKDTVGSIIQYLTRDYVYIDYSFEQYFNLSTTKTFQIKNLIFKLHLKKKSLSIFKANK
jgi:dephospho-CoA kinase